MTTEDNLNSTQIKVDKVSPPQIRVSHQALQQIALMQENDFTLDGKIFRISIDGKGCNGFEYSTGFSEPHRDDFVVKISFKNHQIPIHLDPFSAFYLQKCELGFGFSANLEHEGFIVNNLQQTRFHGKFWKDDDSKIPPAI